MASLKRCEHSLHLGSMLASYTDVLRGAVGGGDLTIVLDSEADSGAVYWHLHLASLCNYSTSLSSGLGLV